MKFLKIFNIKSKKPQRRVVDFYQASVEKTGRAQIQKMVDRGLSIPIFLL